MPTPSAFDAPPIPRAPSIPDAAPTWRDLPTEPPYGPVLPPRTANLGQGFAPVVVEPDAAITPGQIAMAVGGVLLLVAIGIGAALLLLGDDDDTVADGAPTVAQDDPVDEGELTPVPPQVAPPPAPAPTPSQGELIPQAPGGQGPDGASPDSDANGGDPGVDPAPGDQVDPPGGPDQPPVQADPGEEGTIDLPRLFRLRTLPSGTSEDATTVRQTTRGDDVVTEQITMLTTETAEVGVRATRADDAPERFEALVTQDAEEVSVRGLPGYLIDGHQLVWLVSGAEETLLEIDAPPGVDISALLTIAQGLELVR